MKNRDNAGLHIENRQIQYIARISHGKDSMKMLDVIISRGAKAGSNYNNRYMGN